MARGSASRCSSGCCRRWVSSTASASQPSPTEGISGRQGYTDAHRIRLATVFFVVTVVALWISVGYWRLIGLV